MSTRVRKKDVDNAAREYQHELQTYGPRSLSTDRALEKWQNLVKAYEQQTGKPLYRSNPDDDEEEWDDDDEEDWDDEDEEDWDEADPFGYYEEDDDD